MNIYQILETLKRVEESSAQVGDRVSCPNNITGTIVADAGSSWVIIDDHAETEDDTLEFRKSDCTPIAMAEGQTKHHMWDMAERLSLEQFLDMFPDDEDFYLGVHGVDSREELDQSDWERDHPEIHDTDVKENDDWDDDYESDEGDYKDDPRVHVKQSAVLPDHVQQQILRNPAMRADIIAAYRRQQGMAEGTKFSFANPKQRPGDQVRGTEPARKKKSGAHPFKGRLVGGGAAEGVSEEQRLDPKCWKGYKKQGTKMKGGVRVNNCVPVDEEWEAFVNEYGMTTGGTVTGAAQKSDPAMAKQTAKVSKAVQGLKTAGMPIPSATQATQSIMKDPVKDPQSQLDKSIDAAMGQGMQDIINKGDDSDVNTLKNIVNKINQRSGA